MKNLSDISIRYVKGVGPNRKKLFFNLGVESVEDLLYLFPRRYEDRRNITSIASVKTGETCTISGKVLTQGARRSWYTKKHVSEVIVDDETGQLTCVWFNQPYLDRYFKKDTMAILHGKVDQYKNRLQMVSPEYEIIDSEEDKALNTGRIVPIYPLTKGMSQRYLRKTIMTCLDKYKKELNDELPVSLRNKHRLYNVKRSIENTHFPEDFKDQEEALKRISFEEFFFFQVSIILRRLSITEKPGVSHALSDKETENFLDSFKFQCTSAQKRVIKEIREDMKKVSPMLRLLQGDVGSGKTLVAFFGCFNAFKNGHQSCVMAPTEILARQHYDTIKEMIKGSPMKEMKIALLMSSIKEGDQIKKKIEEGVVDLVIGTHALINEEVNFKNLSFAVIDEQHKFGVRQRALLAKKGTNPDILIMTATPIPRTLCMTLYGDLDLSIIDEMPKGRGKVKTLQFTHEEAEEVYKIIREKVKQGRQAYVVYPIIEESERLDLKAAKEMFKNFKNEIFKDLRIGLVHGQMKPSEAQVIMEQFKNKDIDILVATTVIEVGVDVPNASVMVVEHAERFGLSQLHQLRGRIGRGKEDSLCILVAEALTEESHKRLKAIRSTSDGFKIAQEDLLIRGPGRYFGRHQHGLNELKVADPATQLDILELAREEAKALTAADPYLNSREHKNIKRIIRQRYPTYLSMVTAG